MEKYGTIPKRFTKDWWEYFWEYYKWHVIVGGFILCAAIITVVQLASKINYDVVITYMGEISYSENSSAEIGEALAEIVPDANGNGRTDVQLQILAIEPESISNVQYTMAMETKKVMEIQLGESMVFIADKNQVQTIYDNNLADGIFVPVDTWLDDENSCADHAEGSAEEYFVKFKNCSFFSEYDININDAYIGIRQLRADENTDEDLKKKEAAAITANYLLQQCGE